MTDYTFCMNLNVNEKKKKEKRVKKLGLIKYCSIYGKKLVRIGGGGVHKEKSAIITTIIAISTTTTAAAATGQINLYRVQMRL